MKKLTIKFASLEELAAFSKLLPGGFQLNTTTLTLTGHFSTAQTKQALLLFQGSIVQAEKAGITEKPQVV